MQTEEIPQGQGFFFSFFFRFLEAPLFWVSLCPKGIGGPVGILLAHHLLVYQTLSRLSSSTDLGLIFLPILSWQITAFSEQKMVRNGPSTEPIQKASCSRRSALQRILQGLFNKLAIHPYPFISYLTLIIFAAF